MERLLPLCKSEEKIINEDISKIMTLEISILPPEYKASEITIISTSNAPVTRFPAYIEGMVRPVSLSVAFLVSSMSECIFAVLSLKLNAFVTFMPCTKDTNAAARRLMESFTICELSLDTFI